MRISIALFAASLASLASAVPVVRVVHINKWSSKQINAGADFTLTPIPQDSLQATPITEEEVSALRDVIKDQLTKHAPASSDVSRHGSGPHHRHHRHSFMRYLQSFFTTSRPRHRHHPHPHEDSTTVREETGVASRRRKHHRPTIVELETEGAKPSFYLVRCHRHSGRVQFRQVRKYADMVIVSIVLTFIGVLALIELWGPMAQRFSTGRIRLEDEERAMPLLAEKAALLEHEAAATTTETANFEASPVPEKS